MSPLVEFFIGRPIEEWFAVDTLAKKLGIQDNIAKGLEDRLQASAAHAASLLVLLRRCRWEENQNFLGVFSPELTAAIDLALGDKIK